MSIEEMSVEVVAEVNKFIKLGQFFTNNRDGEINARFYADRRSSFAHV
jgi:hypothetical protein